MAQQDAGGSFYPASCILASPVALILPTATTTPTATATPTATSTATATPTATATVSTAGPAQTGCLVSVSPGEAFNQLGVPHTFTFTCGNAAASFPGGAAIPNPGCFDVHFSVSNVTSGSTETIAEAMCAGINAAGLSSCTQVANPICPVGYAPTVGGICQPPCPPGFTLRSDGLCHFNPMGAPCPAGSSPPAGAGGTNAGGISTDCVAPPLPASVAAQNQVTVTIKPGAPDVYRVDFTGYINTTSTGQCPAGTTLTQGMALTNGTTGPACEFVVSAYKKYVEVTQVNVIPTGTCNPTFTTLQQVEQGGSACLFRVEAIGIVVLKQNTNCSVEQVGTVAPTSIAAGTGTEPSENGVDEVQEPSAEELTEGAAQGPDVGEPGPTWQYVCEGGVLALRMGVPNVQISLTASNGFFPAPGACLPQEVAQTELTTPTPTPTGTLTATSTPSPTATPTPAASPTPVPTVNTAVQPGFCVSLGSSTMTVTTGPNGTAPTIFGEIETAAIPSASTACTYDPYFATDAGVGPTVYICGRIFADDIGLAGSGMNAVFLFPSNPPPSGVICRPVGAGTTSGEALTDTNGLAICYQAGISTAGYTGTDQVPVDVFFDLGGALEGNKCETRTTFVRVGTGGTPTPTVGTPTVTPCNISTAGLAVVPNGLGTLGVTASIASTINSQPPVSSGLVQLGTAGLAVLPTAAVGTATVGVAPTATNTAVPTPTSTPVPTNTPVPTDTPTVTPVPTNTPTPRPTVNPVLRFSLDAARVSKVGNAGNKQGINAMQPGQKVWLMMYYTEYNIPKKVTRVTAYQVQMGASIVFKVAFKGPVSPGETGSKVRYVPMTLPATAHFGLYVYRATLTIGGKSQQRVWRFAVVKTGPGIIPTGYTVREADRRPGS